MSFAAALALYSVIGICFALLVVLFFSRKLFRKLYLPIITVLLLLETVAIGIRWWHTGHPPIFGTFEEALAASWIVFLFAVTLDKEGRFAHFSVPFALITLIYGLNFDMTGQPLTISEQSYWVDFHALFAWIAYGFYTFSFMSAICILFKDLCDNGDDLEEFLYRCLLRGFLAQTIMFALGAYYSSRLYGWWWMWDPVEFLFVASWFLYAIPVHGKMFYGWRDRKLAKYTALAMMGTLLLYWGLIYFPWATYHIFDTELKIMHK